MNPPPPEFPQRKSSIYKTPPAACMRSARVWKFSFWWLSSICCGRFVLTWQDACSGHGPPKRRLRARKILEFASSDQGTHRRCPPRPSSSVVELEVILVCPPFSLSPPGTPLRVNQMSRSVKKITV